MVVFVATLIATVTDPIRALLCGALAQMVWKAPFRPYVLGALAVAVGFLWYAALGRDVSLAALNKQPWPLLAHIVATGAWLLLWSYVFPMLKPKSLREDDQS